MNENIGLVCKQEHFHEENFIRICSDFLVESVRYHRKMWEFVYIFRMLELAGKLNSNSIGLGVGCGYERLVPAMVKTGVNLHVTDLENTWFGLDDTHHKTLHDLFHHHLVYENLMIHLVSENQTYH